MRGFTSSPDVEMPFPQTDLQLSLNAGVLWQEASLTQMQTFKTLGLVEPEKCCQLGRRQLLGPKACTAAAVSGRRGNTDLFL